MNTIEGCGNANKCFDWLLETFPRLRLAGVHVNN